MTAFLLDVLGVCTTTGDTLPGPVLIDGDTICAVGPQARQHPIARTATRLSRPSHLVFPGFVNAHSHAFQRGLRGRVERRGTAAQDDFWSWRTAMYADASALSTDAMQALATWAYQDMLEAGFVSVGEFHYLHRTDAASPGAASHALARAAETVGLQLTLLQTAYQRGGFDKPASPAQSRFTFEDAPAFLQHAAELRAALPSVTHGYAIHSVRACDESWMRAVVADAAAHGAPLHVHANEQRAEVEASLAHTGMRPVALLNSVGALSPHTVIVHGTHVDDGEIALLAGANSQVCICPSTERNLGDGLCPILDLVDAGVSLSIGTDSHARIDVADELRSLEDHERLRTERRLVLVPVERDLPHAVIPAGTSGGRRAVGLPEAPLAAGSLADLTLVECGPEAAAGGPAVAAAAWLVGGSSADVTDVFVRGRHVVAEGKATHGERDAVRARAIDVLRALRG